jgi:hypothetical protein
MNCSRSRIALWQAGIGADHPFPNMCWSRASKEADVADNCEQLLIGKAHGHVEWQLPLWASSPPFWTDVGELMLLVFTQDGAPTWEVNRREKV